MFVRIFAVAAAMCAVSARGAEYAYDAETDPAHTYNNYGAWQVAGVPPTTDYARSPSHSLNITNGVQSPWLAPELADGIQYVAADFYALAPGGSTSAQVRYDVGSQSILAGTSWTANTFVMRSEPYVLAARVSFSGPGTYIDDVNVRPITRAQAATLQDANFAARMPKPFAYAAPVDRFARIPNAAARLAAGQQLNVLMVGDSIINDTFNSFYDSLVDRHYSGAQLRVKASVVGGAGASYWSQGTRIADALATNPDLLMFGGVSTQPAEVPLIHDIIAKARAVNPAIEIVLTDRMAGDRLQIENNPFLNPSLATPLDPNGTEYRSELYRLAAAENVQFWDVTVPWSKYLLASGLQAEDFYRDVIHMNGRGQMVAARVMESFFSPLPTADFTGDGQVNSSDLAAWRTNFGKPSGALHSEGDADGDQDVDGNDFLNWQRQAVLNSVAPVPEPSTLALAAGSAALAAASVHRRRANSP